MTYINVKAELAKAARQKVYGDIELAGDPRGYIKSNTSPETAERALEHLASLSKDGPVTALHFKQAIQDFGKASKEYHAAGEKNLAKKAGDAFEILVKSYIHATGDADVYRAMPEPSPLDIS